MTASSWRGKLFTLRFNIFSGSTDGNGLAAALTNPTTLSRRRGCVGQDYPVDYVGRRWPDAEAAYLTLSAETSSWSRGSLDDLMVDILAAKLRQYPKLASAVQDRGDVAFLDKSEHYTGAKTARFQAYEGFGRESRFIRNLIAVYERWEAQP